MVLNRAKHHYIWSDYINPFSTNFTKWSTTLKQFVGNLSTNCLSVFDHFMGLALKGLNGSFSKISHIVSRLENEKVE